MSTAHEIRAIRTYVSFYVEMPGGALEEILDDDAARARLKDELLRVPGLSGLELDSSVEEGSVYFVLDAEEAHEENIQRAENALRQAVARLDAEKVPAPR